jgi:XTP/dITP diphosphohydrolase
MEILIATSNLHKIREFREMFKPLKGVNVLSLSHFPDYISPEETGSTFLENAAMKAEHAANTLNRLVLADDSGLVVPALEGKPGIYSRRYAGEGASDGENRKKLLEAMSSLEDLERNAYFECALALASPGKLLKAVTASIEGVILHDERGSNGFGYDSLFLKHDYDKALAELDEAIKNRISHRHKAFQKLLPLLEMHAKT